MRIKVYPLLHAAFKQEHQLIFKQLRTVCTVRRRCQLHKHAYAVTLPDFYILHLVSRSWTEILTVNINPETRLVAVGKTHVRTAYAVPGTVIYPHGTCCCRHCRENRVQTHRICRKSQHIRRRRAERIVVSASD